MNNGISINGITIPDREIAFRGRPTYADIGISTWVYGNLAMDKDGNDWIEKTPVLFPGQFTGLRDKNGNRIFEGDICRFKGWWCGEFCWVGVVKFEHCQFLIAGGPNKECETPFTRCLSGLSSEQLEIIGNIYDSPELLEGWKQNG